MVAEKKPAKIEALPHWYWELSKLRHWIMGYKAGRGDHTPLPGEDAVRQIQIALDQAKIK